MNVPGCSFAWFGQSGGPWWGTWSSCTLSHREGVGCPSASCSRLLYSFRTTTEPIHLYRKSIKLMWCKFKDVDKIISRIKLYSDLTKVQNYKFCLQKQYFKLFTGAIQTKKWKRTDGNFIHSTLSHRHMNTDDYGRSPSIQIHGRENNLISPRTMFTVSHRMPSSWWTGNKTLPCRLSTHVLPHSTRPKGGFSSRVAHQMTSALDEVARSPVSL